MSALAEARSFYETHRDATDTLPADKVAAYRRMIDEAEASADQLQAFRKAEDLDNRLGLFDAAATEQNALNEAALPESLKGEPPKAEQIRLAGLNRDYSFGTDLDLQRTMKWMKATEEGMPKEELRLVIGTNNKGGFWTPDYWERMIVSEWRAIEGFTEIIAPMMTGDGNTIYIPTRTAAQVTSSTDIAATLRTETPSSGAPPTSAQYRTDLEADYGRTALETFKALQAQSVSSELLEDSFVNVAEEVGASIGQWFGEFMEHCFTNGTGTGQPKGAWHGITAGQEVNQAASGNPTIKDFHRLAYGNERLRGGNQGYSFVCSRPVWGETLRDISTDNMPWWGIDMNSEGRMMMFGYPVYYGTFVPSAITTGSNPVGFGLWRKYLRTRIVNMMRLTISNIAESTDDTITYRARVRFGSCLLDVNRAAFLNVPS